ncbi:hypothetical protein [Arthrospira platensis]|uniref:hypothetical protein n=2 Tax=Oscillatoriophycideae TaxID=1301283 RepID=UPI000291FA51|nr:hypothetical protein [Arthrospira platensis]KDR54905.1 hypothetical protein APPUASWS_025610 [Arthrospira platensis str. Paraca]MDF2208581.1 hypothetical protein [Arthrospira platensis NCB002]MDT9184382.1 hypothetical protein [Limnospira sp. PMC 289.06]MDT9296555.1 hypothetical protein [Arthrospira platensis PCC 7345]MDT9312231.1 hypothetical protein [Limnospira sp. Paracas R14]QQW29057.2 hypothetical protein AP9108_30515 [Arthrospira sp. PCC 9108]BDT16295.1 hypothetical protein N39L_60180
MQNFFRRGVTVLADGFESLPLFLVEFDLILSSTTHAACLLLLDSIPYFSNVTPLGKNEALCLKIDQVVITTKKDNWIGNHFQEIEVKNALNAVLVDAKVDLPVDTILELIKQQHDYQ